MTTQRNPIPVYTTRGDLGAYLLYPYLFNGQGEWIGWVAPDRGVYSVYGHYVGWLSEDPRILRKRSESFALPRKQPPAAPSPFQLPVRIPLAPMMPELSFGVVDVLEECPELLPALDFGEMRQDLD